MWLGWSVCVFFSAVIPHLSGCRGNDTMTDTEKTICKNLKDVALEAREQHNKHLLETVLMAIGELAK